MLDSPALDRVVRDAVPRTGFSGVVHVAHGLEPLHSSAHGSADRATGRPNTTGTRFAQASGSKSFTAVAVCLLVDNGHFTFDTAMADVLDLWPPRFDTRVTVHHLLSHTSGVPDYFDEELQNADDWFALWSEHPTYEIRGPSDLLPLFAEGTSKFAPGARFAYSNGGFVLLGLLVEQYTGMPFSQFVEEEILARAGMTSSGYFALDDLPDDTAANYLTATDPASRRTNIFAVPAVGQPDGGAFVTAPDMARFWTSLETGDLLLPETVKRLFTAHVDVDAGTQYGYGVWIAGRDGVRAMHYAEGCDPGVSFLSGVWRPRGITVTVIGNTDTSAWSVYAPLVEAILDS